VKKIRAAGFGTYWNVRHTLGKKAIKDLEEHTCMCPNKKHKYRIGITNPNKIHKGGEADVTNTVDRYRIPQDLLRHLFSKHDSLPHCRED